MHNRCVCARARGLLPDWKISKSINDKRQIFVLSFLHLHAVGTIHRTSKYCSILFVKIHEYSRGIYCLVRCNGSVLRTAKMRMSTVAEHKCHSICCCDWECVGGEERVSAFSLCKWMSLNGSHFGLFPTRYWVSLVAATFSTADVHPTIDGMQKCRRTVKATPQKSQSKNKKWENFELFSLGCRPKHFSLPPVFLCSILQFYLAQQQHISQPYRSAILPDPPGRRKWYHESF